MAWINGKFICDLCTKPAEIFNEYILAKRVTDCEKEEESIEVFDLCADCSTALKQLADERKGVE